jgi:hypothetical protein
MYPANPVFDLCAGVILMDQHAQFPVTGIHVPGFAGRASS